MNLSLGSDNGWADDDTASNRAYQRLNEAGITFMISAGNSADSTEGNMYGGNTLTADPETSMISAPAVYADGLAVASMENSVAAQSFLYWTDAQGNESRACFADPNDIAMKATLGEGEWNVIPVGGYGTYELTFQINNISDRDVTCSVHANLARPDTDVFESYWGNAQVALAATWC